jgi:hypothetical protein
MQISPILRKIDSKIFYAENHMFISNYILFTIMARLG